ncbi:MAG: hypothetical protein US94_C0008G0010 [Berkelbacteria bacterium GW2011_GWB1_38_5]|uniref:Type 4 fimbrial biogenesis protein PilX N-terminal domain-containing protein n=2 Tax=Candidatus Berkelbacteria TaxID=1618330 RepID=A0A0G0LFH1_9BACT|nr:MAG: hypothetical protein US94_C0008G0010 [Berkelbacteria bacterium GW2011_GWB1_38_5]KKQ90593.1 MAG: hypothetical protein UT15_C0009G0024 [Berkelbacteria bacterium GW2011_GWA1_39_10]
MRKIKTQNLKANFRGGQALLVAILMVTAATLAIGLAIAAIGSTQVNIALASKQSAQAYGLSESCLENTLMRMARANFSVPPPFTNGLGNCTIEISGSVPYQITSTGNVGKTYRKIRATVIINNEVINIQKWEEVY